MVLRNVCSDMSMTFPGGVNVQPRESPGDGKRHLGPGVWRTGSKLWSGNVLRKLLQVRTEDQPMLRNLAQVACGDVVVVVAPHAPLRSGSSTGAVRNRRRWQQLSRATLGCAVFGGAFGLRTKGGGGTQVAMDATSLGLPFSARFGNERFETWQSWQLQSFLLVWKWVVVDKHLLLVCSRVKWPYVSLNLTLPWCEVMKWEKICKICPSWRTPTLGLGAAKNTKGDRLLMPLSRRKNLRVDQQTSRFVHVSLKKWLAHSYVIDYDHQWQLHCLSPCRKPVPRQFLGCRLWRCSMFWTA